MRVGFVQFEPIFGQKGRNVKKSIRLIESVDADLLVLPELCNTGYLFLSREEAYELSEEIPEGPTVQAWMDVSERKRVHLVAGIAERVGERVFNSAVLIRPSGEVDVYRKAHLFFKEKIWFEKGDKPFKVYDIGCVKIGIMICFDWIFPEVARILSLQGAEIICHPANLILPYCQDAMVTRCIENRVFAITCNRTGMESRGGEKLRYSGRSQVVDPNGNVLVRAGIGDEAVEVVEIDPDEAKDKHITALNNLFKDRRVDMFGRIIRF